jgi:dolichol-phosphate mannosyltransferase
MIQHNNHHPPPAVRTDIILPTYNERENIVELVQAIERCLEPEGFNYRVIVVDDNSPDGTAELVRASFGDDPRVELHVRTQERGLATALRYGAEHSDGEVLVFMDTDFNHDPDMIPQLIKFLEYYDVVIGSRFVMRGGMEDSVRYAFSFVYNLGLRLLFRTQVWDNLSGFFAIRRHRLLELNLDQIFYGYGDYFIRLLMVGWRRGWHMLEIPVFYRLRMHGHSKTQFLRIFTQYTIAIIKLRGQLWMEQLKSRRIDKRVDARQGEYPTGGRS